MCKISKKLQSELSLIDLLLLNNTLSPPIFFKLLFKKQTNTIKCKANKLI